MMLAICWLRYWKVEEQKSQFRATTELCYYLTIEFICVKVYYLSMPIVTVSLFTGRSQREKDRLAEAITDDICKHLKVEKKEVVIIFQENPVGNWYAEGVRLQDLWFEVESRGILYRQIRIKRKQYKLIEGLLLTKSYWLHCLFIASNLRDTIRYPMQELSDTSSPIWEFLKDNKQAFPRIENLVEEYRFDISERQPTRKFMKLKIKGLCNVSASFLILVDIFFKSTHSLILCLKYWIQ